jgi:hypothetical protein
MHTLYRPHTPPPAPSPARSAAATATTSHTVIDALSRAVALHTDGAVTDAYAWAHHAHQLSRCLPADDPDRMRVTGLLAALAAQTGDPHLAISLYEQLAATATNVLGADHAQTLRARAALAAQRHSLGDCARALHELADVHAAARHRYGGDARLSLETLIALGALYRDCGHHQLAVRCLTAARTGIHRYLPSGDPLANRVTATLGTPPSLNHLAVCAMQRPRLGATS